jgi:hypothetical protein
MSRSTARNPEYLLMKINQHNDLRREEIELTRRLVTEHLCLLAQCATGASSIEGLLRSIRPKSPRCCSRAQRPSLIYPAA